MERGQKSFDQNDYAEALRLFKAALELSPNEDEACAALYNKACAHARLKNWQEAANDVVSAVNDYGLKLDVAVKVCHCAAIASPDNAKTAVWYFRMHANTICAGR